MTTMGHTARVREALLPGDPLSLDEAVELTGAAREATVSALNHLTGRGELVLVRRRLWVRAGGAVDPYRLAARVVSPYAFSYGSALALVGAGPAERSEMLVSSPHRFSQFVFEGVRYRWARPWQEEGLARVTVGPEFVWTTEPERTVVECVRVPANAGGMQELSRSLDLLPELDDDRLLGWVDHYAEAALASRLGYLLERTGLYGSQRQLLRALAARVPTHRVYLAERRPGGQLVKRWNLIVPPYLAPPPA
jgi:predicted transcriptional regulator of viral defense system